MKYLTKDSAKNISELGMHMYYSSKNLKTSELLFRGKLILHCEWGYETPDGFCRIKDFDSRYQNYKDYVEELK